MKIVDKRRMQECKLSSLYVGDVFQCMGGTFIVTKIDDKLRYINLENGICMPIDDQKIVTFIYKCKLVMEE